MASSSKQIPKPLASVYSRTDVSDDQFAGLLADVNERTAIEREWLSEAGYQPFANDRAILEADRQHKLVRVQPSLGFVTIQRLAKWSPERSNPEHPFHYSPPYLRPTAAMALGRLSHRWQTLQRKDGQPEAYLSVTSLVRSTEYQRRLRGDADGRKLAAEVSSHEFGFAFDIDACGLYMSGGRTVNPRQTDAYDEQTEALEIARANLREVFEPLIEKKVINVIEELPGTQEHCFHVGTNPAKLAGDY